MQKIVNNPSKESNNNFSSAAIARRVTTRLLPNTETQLHLYRLARLNDKSQASHKILSFMYHTCRDSTLGGHFVDYTYSEIAQRLSLSIRTVSRIMSWLIKYGFVNQSSKSQRDKYYRWITCKGITKLGRINYTNLSPQEFNRSLYISLTEVMNNRQGLVEERHARGKPKPEIEKTKDINYETEITKGIFQLNIRNKFKVALIFTINNSWLTLKERYNLVQRVLKHWAKSGIKHITGYFDKAVSNAEQGARVKHPHFEPNLIVYRAQKKAQGHLNQSKPNSVEETVSDYKPLQNYLSPSRYERQNDRAEDQERVRHLVNLLLINEPHYIQNTCLRELNEAKLKGIVLLKDELNFVKRSLYKLKKGTANTPELIKADDDEKAKRYLDNARCEREKLDNVPVGPSDVRSRQSQERRKMWKAILPEFRGTI